MKRSRVLLPNTIRLSPWLYTSFIFLFLLLQLVSGQQEQQQDSSLCCHVVAFAAEELADDGTWAFAATMSSPYEIGWEKYCDSFEVRTLPASKGGNYTVLAKRVFGHPHPTEQPFTRRVFNVVLPDGVDTVVAVAHDLIDGFCGNELTLTLAGSEPTSVTAPPTTPPPVLAPLPTPVPTGAPVATNTEAPVIPSAPITVTPETGTPVITGAPAARPPVTDAPVTLVPVPVTFAPITSTPTSEAPVTVAPTTNAPSITKAPVTSAPIVNVAPTMVPSSTPAPTNTVPTAPSVKPSDDSGAYRSVSITAALVVAAFFLV